MTSVNYNASATAALRTLQNTNSQLDAVQNRISTGFKIGEAKDNAAYWSISTTLKSDNKSLSTVKDALGLGAATIDVAYEGLNAAKDVLDEIKSKLTSATQAGVDRAAVQADIDALQEQLKSIAGSSTFSGENWLSINSGVAGYDSTKSVVASFSRDANNGVTIGKINVDIKDVALFDANAINGGGIVDGKVALKKADGTELMIGGTNSTNVPVSKQGLATAVGVDGTPVAAASSASISLGKLDFNQIDFNDSLTFDIAVDGGVAKKVTLDLSQFKTGGTNAFVGTYATDVASFLAGLKTAVEAAGFAEGATAADDVSITADTTTGEIKIASSSAGATSTLAVSNLNAVDGNGATNLTSVGGMTVSSGAKFGTGVVASFDTGAAFTAATAASVGDKVAFKFQYNGDVYETSFTYDASNITADATTFKNLMDVAIANSTKVSDGARLGAGKVSLVNASGNMKLETTSSSDGTSVALVQVTATPASGVANNAGILKGLQVGTAGLAKTTVGAATYSLAVNGAGPTFTPTFSATNLLAGDTIKIDLTVAHEANGTVTATRKTVSLSTNGMSSTTTPADFATKLQSALDATFGAGVLTAAFDAGSTTGLSISTVGKGINESITVNSINAASGDGHTTSKLGLAGAANAGKAATTLSAATLTTGEVFAATEFKDSDKLTFNINVSGLSRDVTIDKSVVDAALTAGDGYTAGSGNIANAANFAKVVAKALDTAGVAGVNVAAVSSGADTGKLKLTAAATGAGSIVISNVATQGASTADTISVDEIDITSAEFKALTDTQQADVMSAYISVVNQAISKVTASAAGLGSISKRIELQQGFVNTLMDTIDKGVSGLVDADMSEESTKLQALQTKQQLGVQALSIANSSAQNILSLFR